MDWQPIYWLVIGFLVGLIVMHELWRWLYRSTRKLDEELIAEQRAYIEALEGRFFPPSQQQGGE